MNKDILIQTNKIEYLIDEEFVHDGIIVNAIYNNGTQSPVLDFEITGFDSYF